MINDLSGNFFLELRLELQCLRFEHNKTINDIQAICDFSKRANIFENDSIMIKNSDLIQIS